MSIKTKLRFALLLSAMLILFLVGMQLQATWQVRHQVRYFLPASEYLLAISSAQSAISSQMKEAVDYLLTGSRLDYQEYEAHGEDVHAAFDRWIEVIRQQQQLGVSGEVEDLDRAYEVLHRYSRWEAGLEGLFASGQGIRTADLAPLLATLEQEIFPRFNEVLKDGFHEVEDSYRDLLLALGRLQPWVLENDLAQLRAAHESINAVISGHSFNAAVNHEFMALALFVLSGDHDDLNRYRNYSRDALVALEAWDEVAERQTGEPAAEIYSTFRKEEYLAFRALMNLAVARKLAGNDTGALELLVDRFDVMPGFQGLGGLRHALQHAGGRLVEQTSLSSQFGTLIIVLVLVALGILLLVVIRQIIARLAVLHVGIEQVADGDLDHRVELPGGDELAELAGGFNRMVEHLRQSREELAELNRGLEQRVGERTGQLQEKNRELEAFNAMVSHDLRGQLSIVSGYAQYLKQQLDEGAVGQADELVGKILFGAARMQQIVESLHSLARMSDGELQSVAVDLSSMAGDICRRLGERSSRREVRFEITPGVVASGDPALLQIALENLLENAWKYTARSAPARIEFGVQHDSVRSICFVRDNGVGFDPKQAGELFTPFRRLATAEGFDGKGIGLSIVKRVIERHGGEIWAEGAPGEGTTIFWTLPMWRSGDEEVTR